MTDQDPSREEVFVVRFWPDPARPEANGWRGCVDHVVTGERQFFVELSALTEFVSAGLKAASSRRTPQKR